METIKKKVLNLFNTDKNLFPKTLDIAPAYHYTDKTIKIDGVEYEYLMHYFLEKKYVRYEEGQIIPILRKDGITAYYKIDRKNRRGSSMDDYASWDDRTDYKMSISHTENNPIISDNEKK